LPPSVLLPSVFFQDAWGKFMHVPLQIFQNLKVSLCNVLNGFITKCFLHPVTSHLYRDSVRWESRKVESRRRAIRYHEDSNSQKDHSASDNKLRGSSDNGGGAPGTGLPSAVLSLPELLCSVPALGKESKRSLFMV
jgi:hypothetical protein